MSKLTIHVCDPSPHSSFEEQWGAQVGAEQERLAEQDHESDRVEAERIQFMELLNELEYEPDLEDEDMLEKWTETQEPEIIE